jgi:hypothetical protein
MWNVAFRKYPFSESGISVCLESLLENTRFLKAEIINSFIMEEKNEEILVSFVVAGAGHGLQCVSLRG